MLDWLKLNKDYPEFWRKYLQNFENKSARYVIFATETSGLNSDEDKILSIGAVGVQEDKIIVADSFDVNIYQENISTLQSLESNERISQTESIVQFLEYIKNATLVGHRIHFEIELLNKALDKMGCGRLKNEAIDIEVMFRKWKELSDDRNISLDDLSNYFKIVKTEHQSASNDAYTIALIFLRLKQRLKI
ncbi:3'-5' exonuclease [Flavobacterium sp. NST-5]|uniref:3'-5' exonuclease n=1 Tax=Flavobacterium ichthyis TaxID=2698827 RepID=A0ABW9ZEJ5_9FLAO|nr:3'-5' exonuclease [Flavobacterium ichthyis]NBL65203.1 3'-5' exonuclease [Flavobacterium ichthyis]